MSLKRLLTGQPANIKEFAQMAKKNSSLVDMLIHIWQENAQSRDILIVGEAIYSIRNELYPEKAERDILLIKRYTAMEAEPSGCMLNRIRKEAQPNLDYLTKQGVEYQLSTLNEAHDNSRKGIGKGVIFNPEDVLISLFNYFPLSGEFPADMEAIQKAFHRLRRLDPEILQEFTFDHDGIFPHSDVLYQAIKNLKISRYLTAVGWNSSSCRIEQITDSYFSMNLSSKFSEYLPKIKSLSRILQKELLR